VRQTSIFIVFICIAAINSFQPLYAQPESVFNAYVQALLAKEWEKAETYWLPEEIQASKRFGISYTGIEAKYDCASPLTQMLEAIRSGDMQVTVTDTVNHDDWAQISAQFTAVGESLVVPYYLVKSTHPLHGGVGGGWRLASPLFVYARNWMRHDTRYATVHFSDASLINEYALNELDRFVASMGEHLALSEAEMKCLEKEKIDYYLCSEEEIENLTGFSTQGLTNLQFDAIISRRLPHYHEMVHFLVNYALKELPLYTLPCLQEGIAVCFGGRWDKSPQVVFQVGHFTLAQSFFSVEDVLTYNGFHETVGNPDFSYPISGIFVKFLIEQLGKDSSSFLFDQTFSFRKRKSLVGVERFKLLYRGLSGTDDAVRAFSIEDVQSKISKIYGTPWEEIQKKFAGYWGQFEFSGLVPGGLPANEPIVTMKSEHLSVQIWDSDNDYLFEIRATTDIPKGVILMKDKSSPGTESYQSGLFAEHLPSARYDGEVYGIQFSPDEAGLYNYYMDTLVAKYISSFSPKHEYWNSEERMVCFRLEKSVLNQKISDFQIWLVEP
jgi:hypothetical protein